MKAHHPHCAGRTRRRRQTAVTLLLGALLSGGCALSPQQVPIQPAFSVPQRDFGAGLSIALAVTDSRPHAYFGERGGVYDTAYITPEGDITAPVRSALEGALGRYGFTVTGARQPADLSMLVNIQAIDYEASGNAAMTTVDTRVSLGFELAAPDGQVFNGDSSVSQSTEVALKPGEARNAELINQTLSLALERLMSDARVLNFLQQP